MSEILLINSSENTLAFAIIVASTDGGRNLTPSRRCRPFGDGDEVAFIPQVAEAEQGMTGRECSSPPLFGNGVPVPACRTHRNSPPE